MQKNLLFPAGGWRKAWHIGWVRSNLIYTSVAKYFPLTLHKTADIPPTVNYLMVYHPHGVLCYGLVFSFGFEGCGSAKLFPGIRPYLATLESNFRIPLHRDLFLFRGLISCSRDSLEYVLNQDDKGNAVALVVGGAAEAFDAIPGTMKLTLNNRKGFIKLALSTGAHLIPVIGFGENEIFDQTTFTEGSLAYRIQRKLHKLLGFSLPIFHGRWFFKFPIGFLPYPRPIDVVVGKPIPVTRKESPTKEEIDELHEKYTEELVKLFHDHKHRFPGSKNVEIINGP